MSALYLGTSNYHPVSCSFRKAKAQNGDAARFMLYIHTFLYTKLYGSTISSEWLCRDIVGVDFERIPDWTSIVRKEAEMRVEQKVYTD